MITELAQIDVMPGMEEFEARVGGAPICPNGARLLRIR